MQFTKKHLVGALCAFALLFPSLSFAINADYDPGTWDYTFHLQIKNGVLGAQSSGNAYEVTINTGEATLPPSGTDFRMDIVGVKGNTLGSYGFNDPKTYTPALEKTVFDVKVPFFANGGRALVFNKAGKKLIDLSLAGTSFCNDNKKCEMATGENFANCSNDCPPPVVSSGTGTIEPGINPENPPVITTPSTPIEPVKPSTSTTNEGTTTYTEGSMGTRNVVIPLTVGIFAILLAIVGFLAWKKHKEEDIDL